MLVDNRSFSLKKSCSLSEVWREVRALEKVSKSRIKSHYQYKQWYGDIVIRCVTVNILQKSRSLCCPFIISSNSVLVEINSVTWRQKLSPPGHCLTAFRLWWFTWNWFDCISKKEQKPASQDSHVSVVLKHRAKFFSPLSELRLRHGDVG